MADISILDISDSAKHVYIINNTKTDISITVKDEDGASRLLRILRASIPQDAAEIVSPSVLKKCSSFKRALASGYLTLCDEKQAEKVLATSEAKIEFASIKKKLSRIPQELMVTNDEATPIEAVSGTATDGTIRAEIKDIALDVDESSDDKLARLISLNKEEPISEEEKTWLVSRLPERFSQVLSWLNKQNR